MQKLKKILFSFLSALTIAFAVSPLIITIADACSYGGGTITGLIRISGLKKDVCMRLFHEPDYTVTPKTANHLCKVWNISPRELIVKVTD